VRQHINVTSIDPGWCNPITAVIRREDLQEEEIFMIDRGEYYFRLRTTTTHPRSKKYYSKCSRNKWRIRGYIPSAVTEAQANISLNSCDTLSADTYMIFLKQNLLSWMTLSKFYGSKTAGRLRLYRFQRKQATFDYMLIKLAPDKSQIIAFGGGFCGHPAWKGTKHSAAPLKEFRRYCARFRRVVITPEYLTSQKCPICGEYLSVETRDNIKEIITYPAINGKKMNRRQRQKYRKEIGAVIESLPTRDRRYCCSI